MSLRTKPDLEFRKHKSRPSLELPSRPLRLLVLAFAPPLLAHHSHEQAATANEPLTCQTLFTPFRDSRELHPAISRDSA